MCITYSSYIIRERLSKQGLWFHRTNSLKHAHTHTHLHRYTNTHSQIVGVTESLVLLSQHGAQCMYTIWTVKINVFVFLDLPRFPCALENENVPVARSFRESEAYVCEREPRLSEFNGFILWKRKQEWDGREMH